MRDTIASYNFGEFLIDTEIDLNDQIDITKFKLKDCATLFHEFLHYYQDISLGFCQNLFIERNKVIASLNNDAKELNTIEVPLKLDRINAQRYELMNLYRKKRTLNEWDKVVISSSSQIEYAYKKTTGLSLDNPAMGIAETVYFRIDDSDWIELDGIVIAEGMAWAYEKAVFLIDTENWYEVGTPYCIPYMLATKICHNRNWSIAEVGLVCEAALEFHHAGRQFIWILENLIRDKNIEPKNIVDYILVTDACGNIKNTTFKKYLFRNFEEYIYSIYNIGSELTYSTDIIDRAYFAFRSKILSQTKFLMYELVMTMKDNSDEEKKQSVINWICIFAPFIRVADLNVELLYRCVTIGRSHYVETHDTTWLIWSGFEVIWNRLLEGKISVCPYIDECEKGHIIIEGCKTDPFNNGPCNCLLGNILARMGLRGKKIISA